MSLFRPSKLKVEGYLYIRNDGNYIALGQRKVVYLLVPEEIREFLRSKFGINLQRRPKEFNVVCQLVIEENIPRLIFTFTPKGEVLAQRNGGEEFGKK